MKLSIVVPVYNEEGVIPEFFKRMEVVLAEFINKYGVERDDIEVLWVNDGSQDNSFGLLKAICDNYPGYSLINLSRNYGHQLAITAGMEQAGGEAVVTIDADLQDPPETILVLYEKFLEGYEVVNARRIKREGEGFFKLVTAKIFYRLLKRMTQVEIPVDSGDFRIVSRRVAEVLSGMREQERFLRGMVGWVGFRQTSIAYIRDKRFAGKTKYPFSKMLKFALDGITSFSSVPLKLSSYLGFLAALSGFLYSLVVLYIKFFTDTTVPGWASIICVVLFLGGAQLFCMGMIGEYISRIHIEAKNRPLYLIEGIYGRAREKVDS